MKRLLFISLLLPLAAYAADADFTLTIKDQRFQPSEFAIPSGKKIKLLVEIRMPCQPSSKAMISLVKLSCRDMAK
jgi:hypothetical protein